MAFLRERSYYAGIESFYMGSSRDSITLHGDYIRMILGLPGPKVLISCYFGRLEGARKLE